jgi:FAD/FMN-containing dehydrogenase
MDQLTVFLSNNPHIRHAIPQSPDFEELRLGFLINESNIPAIIIRPRSAEEVAALIPVLTKNNLQFAVRVGGHDMFGRSQVTNKVTIDLREISHINVDVESQTARLGGGVICMDMLEELHKHNVTTPFGVTPSVGQVGWATYGGYGLLSSTYGLGVDQIVGAKIVDAEGQIRDADEPMMTGIRGGGGSLGVIVEITVKIYPQDQVLMSS